MTDQILVLPDPEDPDYLYMSHCILCGIPAAKHTEEACDAKMKAWKPKGLLAALQPDEASAGEEQSP